jgi:ketosteroid isomerase-like protein
MEPTDVALLFVERINAGDLSGLVRLMTEDHAFVDATGAVHSGRDRMREGWAQYFQAFPDYRIEVERSVAQGTDVVLIGSAAGSFQGTASRSFRIPVALVARVVGDQVREWRVLGDVEPMLRSMGVNRY